MTAVVRPPDRTVWWDVNAVTADVLAKLRLRVGDVDEPRIRALVDVAGEIINDFIDADPHDRTDIEPTAAWQHAIRSLTRELYGRRDIPVMAPGGGTRMDRMDVDADRGRIDDILAGIRTRKQRWGVA